MSPTTTTTYTLTASNATGTVSRQAALTVTAAPPLPTASLTVTPGSIQSGGTATLSWTTTNATTVTVDQGIGAVAATGSQNVNPTATTTYTLTASNATGSLTRAAALTVTATPPTGPVTLTYQVNAPTNDVNELNDALSANDSTIWLGNGGSPTTSYTGLTFAGIAIPAGATVESARLEVYSSQAQWTTVMWSIAAEQAGNSAPFSTTNRPSQRTRTTSQVNHSSNAQWLANTWYQLDDMKSVIQEVVSRADWQSGNALSVILRGTERARGVESSQGASKRARRRRPAWS